MKVNKKFLKTKKFWTGVILLSLGFVPEVQEVAKQNAPEFNELLDMVLSMFGLL